MAQRRKARGLTEETELGQDEETETFFQYGANFYEASSSKFTHSANPDEECRFILLGGDVDANKDACRIILRNQQNQQITELEEDWEVKENHVQGRLVTVAISPPTWLEHLRSYTFQFFGIRSIKNDIKKCLSVAFPGPNAFLLVIRDGRDNGKEHFLLKAVASVFGNQALDYSMVLLIKGSGQKHSDPVSMKCVKKCGQRLHVLEDTDSSVQELFSKVLSMVGDKKMKFCIPPEYEEFIESEFESWEKRRISNMNEFLQKELDASKKSESELQKELDASKKSESELQKELDASKKSESELQRELDAPKKSVSELQKELDASKKSEHELQKKLDATKKSVSELQKELDAPKKSVSELQKELDASKKSEHDLQKELDAPKKSVSELQKELDASKKNESELQKELDASKKSESELQKNLDASKKSESELKKKLDASKKREHELQKELEASNKSESELQKELEATQLRETSLIKELDDFRRNECNPGRLLDSAQQRESEVNKEDCGVKKDNTVQEPQASGTRNRRGSKDLEVPNLSTDQTHHRLGSI